MTGTLCNEGNNKTIHVNPSAGGPDCLTELVRGEERRLLERVAPLVRSQSVSLDLRSIKRIDAAGIAALISLYRNASEAGHTFSIAEASPRVAQILALVGLDKILMSHNANTHSHSGNLFRPSAVWDCCKRPI